MKLFLAFVFSIIIGFLGWSYYGAFGILWFLIIAWGGLLFVVVIYRALKADVEEKVRKEIYLETKKEKEKGN
jgi:nitric oxide reductase large subunit